MVSPASVKSMMVEQVSRATPGGMVVAMALSLARFEVLGRRCDRVCRPEAVAVSSLPVPSHLFASLDPRYWWQDNHDVGASATGCEGQIWHQDGGL